MLDFPVRCQQAHQAAQRLAPDELTAENFDFG